MNADLKQCERTARTEGLAAGLALALSGFDALAMAPGRYAAVPAKTAPDAASVVVHSLACAEDIVFADCGSPRARDAGAAPAGTELAEFGRRLAAVRLGLTRRLLDTAAEHLSGRSGGGEPLVRKQMVTGMIADIVAGIELLRGYAAFSQAPGTPQAAVLADLHARIADLDTEVIRLFGAAGYIADHPARVLYVSALVASTWVAEGEDQ